ncbi:MAG: hypothetical protein ACW97A_05720 [Candidatus Thorarchaeota archaeon]|jgi:hypothetical protein
MADLKEISKWLVLLGGILGILYGVLQMANMGWGLITFPLFALDGLIMGIILIVLSLIVLATSGVVDIPALKFDNNWVVILILGILMWIFGGDLASVLVIIGAILLLL